MNHLDRFKNLLVMADIDGKVTDEELQFLANRAQRWGVTDVEFQTAVQEALAHRGDLLIPSRQSERLEMLRDLLRMMAADGELSDVEKGLYATAAGYMDIGQDELNRLIDEVLAQARSSRH